MFKCENCDHDLVIRTEETIYNTYEFKSGSLQHIDSDSYGSSMYLECMECGERYEFEDDLISIQDAPKFVMHNLKSPFKPLDVELDDLRIRRCKG
jgi:hypothetical protein